MGMFRDVQSVRHGMVDWLEMVLKPGKARLSANLGTRVGVGGKDGGLCFWCDCARVAELWLVAPRCGMRGEGIFRDSRTLVAV